MEAPAKALDLGEIARRLANAVRPATIAELDLPAARARARYAADPDGKPVLTGWLPWIGHAAGEDRAWRPPSIGEQVLLLAPYGELSAAFILPGAYRDEFPAPDPDASGSKHVVAYRDGAIVSYDSEAHELSAVLPGGGTAAINAPGGVTVTGDTEVDGDVTVDGDLSVTGDLDVDGKIEAGGNIKADGSIEAGGNVSDAAGSLAEMRRVFNRHSHLILGPPPVTVPAPLQKMR